MESAAAARPKHDPPHGSEDYDLGGVDDIGALNTEQQEKLNSFKVKTRIENEQYLRDHPELECLLCDFLHEVVRMRPDNVRDFAADFFTNPALPKTIERLLTERQKQIITNDIIKKTVV